LTLKQRVDAVIDAAVGSRIVGCVVQVSERGKSLYARSAGFADREAGTPVSEDTIFRMASVTKPIVAATALRMIDLGLLSLDDPVTKYLPFFAPAAPDGTTPAILIRHLLTHTSGLSYDNVPSDVSRGSDQCEPMPLTENLRRLSRQPLTFSPGSKWEYGMSIDVLGGVLAQINRSDLEGAVRRYVTEPLGMADTHFSAADIRRLAYPYADGTPPVRMSEPHLLPTGKRPLSPRRILQRNTPQSGGSGMAGTAGDFTRLLTALLGDFLKPETRDMAFADQIASFDRNLPGEGFGFFGAVIRDTARSGWPTEGMIHWGGTWGNNWILEPKSGTTVVVYTNTATEGCDGRFRAEIRDAVFA
jgi:CubicO group peptidase (beta-lactamase class C family)